MNLEESSNRPHQSANSIQVLKDISSYVVPPETRIRQTFLTSVRGEKAAEALEDHLTNLESQLDRLLAAIENNKESQEYDGNSNRHTKGNFTKPSYL